MDAEMHNMKTRKVWSLVPAPPKEVKVVGCRWVYNLKKNNEGKAVRYKARLVAQGFSQRKGENYDVTFPPVINFSLIRLFFAIFVNLLQWLHWQVDVNCAYLYAKLDETVYMRQPPGYKSKKYPDYVCKLDPALYGLKQSGRQWFTEISSVLEKLGFTKLKWANGVFLKNKVILLLYVDDIVILGKTNKEIQMTVKLLANNFDLKIIGKTRTLLGIQFIEENNKVYLSQEHYITEVYNRYKKFLPPISSLPISKGSVYSKLQCPTTDEETKEMERYPYRSVIGCLAFIASRTRPDINYAINLFSQFQSNPGVVHWSGLMKLLGYLQATRNYKLDIGNIAEISLTAYLDADFASCTDDRISVGGHVVFCGNAPVSWRTAKQKSMTLSSVEAEFLSICETSKELMWLKNVLEECQSTNVLLGDISCKLLSDNMAAIQFSKSSIENNLTKHTDVKFHFVRNLLNLKV
ncbi:Retrovirus-related Pol polyprotein from transposon RE2 [Araneus ventricosus]|uniref:Retrovirus-related Pol polyprotein from transposon RE2 n=1 Tax=Araneus ventricosus TaxID=182803 RepID=A0A4Y2F7T7_ARAVE|nr:Retrovirus-related Pol polyprotein from transposon RE2 [Araneus ventricosus]